MLKLYITRHGETVWNTEKRMQGWKDSDLTQNGIDNAIRLGKRLNNVDFEAVYVSTSKRTRRTAELICGERNLEVNIDDNLREINMGDWEGKLQSEIAATYQEQLEAFWKTPHLYTSATGENFTELRDRVLKVINRIKKENRDGNVLVVTHGVVIKSLMAYFKNSPTEKLWDPPYIMGTSLSIVEIYGDKEKVVMEGDFTHGE